MRCGSRGQRSGFSRLTLSTPIVATRHRKEFYNKHTTYCFQFQLFSQL